MGLLGWPAWQADANGTPPVRTIYSYRGAAQAVSQVVQIDGAAGKV